jgi:hypothetical protein
MKASTPRSKKLSPIAQRIRDVQKGKPVPKTAVSRVISRWNDDVARKFKQRKAIRDLDSKSREKMLGRFLTNFSKDKDILDAQKEIRELARRLAQRKVTPPRTRAMEPRITGGSVISVLGAPYDTIWASNHGGAATNQSFEDALGGTFGFTVTADGSAYAAAGIGSFFRPRSSLPIGHFRPFMRVSYNYLDTAWWASTAHNDGYLHSRVVSLDRNFNIVKWPPDDTSVQLWADGVSVWDDTHNVDVEDDFPGILDVQFELDLDHVYLLWTWCECYLDDASASFAHAGMSVSSPFWFVEETDM